ncbi:hypothetical protein ABID16_001112 [Rhizobium aquaticum]|uniref:Phage abortive infection protein n=1 Tax=Rhizobium aquaticum TaxID=1549636 RepID=A0ABV2IWE5_9HYPH
MRWRAAAAAPASPYNSMQWDPNIKLGDLVGAFSATLALVGLFLTVKKYFQEQAWNRRIKIIERIDDFYTDNEIRNALYMLDWDDKFIVTSAYQKVATGIERMSFNNDKIRAALVVEFEGHDPELIYIRDCFDSFFSELVLLQHWTDTGIIRIDDLVPYLGYYAAAIRGKSERKSSEVQSALQIFIEEFYGRYKLGSFLEKIAVRYVSK